MAALKKWDKLLQDGPTKKSLFVYSDYSFQLTISCQIILLMEIAV